jgi:hypothetical protein
MLGYKKDKNLSYMGSKGNHSLLGMGHKKHPIQSSHSNVKGTDDISKHKTMDENQPTGLNVKKNKSKTSGIEKN